MLSACQLLTVILGFAGFIKLDLMRCPNWIKLVFGSLIAACIIANVWIAQHLMVFEGLF